MFKKWLTALAVFLVCFITIPAKAGFFGPGNMGGGFIGGSAVIAQPNEIGTLYSWFKSDTGVTEATGGVSAWADQSGQTSGFAHDVLQTVEGQRPDLIADCDGGGNACIRFDGVDDELISALHTGLAGTDTTVFVVAKLDATDGSDTLFQMGSTSTINVGTQYITTAGPVGRFRSNDGGNKDVTRTPSSGEKGIYEWHYDAGGNKTAYFNGVSQGTVAVGTMAGIQKTSVGGLQSTALYNWDGDIYEIIVYDELLTTNEADDVRAYLENKYSSLLVGVPAFNIEGDSLSVLGGGGDPWFTQLQAQSGYNAGQYHYNNYANAGDTCDDILTSQSSQVLSGATIASNPIAVLWCGTNDIYVDSSSGASVFSDIEDIADVYAAAGFHVYVLNCIARTGTAGQDTERAALNTALAGESSASYTVCDVAANTELQDETNATYFSGDEIHLTEAGYTIVMNTVKSCIEG